MRAVELVNGGKECSSCKEWKPIESFHKTNRNRAHKYLAICKECMNSRNKLYMQKMREKTNKCLTCGKAIMKVSKHCRLCAKQAPGYLDKISKRVYTKRVNNCVDCKKQIPLRGTRCVQCKSKGSLNAMWKGGVNPVQKSFRGTLEYRQWRSDVFTRDSFTCSSCNEVGGELNAHHIIPVNVLFQKYEVVSIDDVMGCAELFNINNGITLCKGCHSELHKERGYK